MSQSETVSPASSIVARPVMDRKEAADYLRVSIRTLTNLVSARRIRAAHIGRKPVFKRAELDRYIDLLSGPMVQGT